MRSLVRRILGANKALRICVKFEDGLLLDHHPCHPGIGYGQQEEKADHGVGAEVKELDTKGEREEDASGKDVDGPF